MGSIYWQLNDSWPVASWSSIDYYGRLKALHYFAKRFYQGVALGLFNDGDKITINVANELRSTFNGYIKAGVRKNDFTSVYEITRDVSISPLSSFDIDELENKDFNGHRDAYFYAELYDSNDNLIASNTELGTVPKHFKLLNPEIAVDAYNGDGGVWLSLSAKAFAKNVEISFKHHDILLSDNYFDILDDTTYRVFAKTDLCAKELLEDVSIISVYDIPLR
jgi:beta-mannosidase